MEKHSSCRKLVCNIALQSGAVTLLMAARGITMTGCEALSRTNFLAASTKARAKLQPQLAEVTLFGTELAKSHRFISSGLNLAFEELLLGVSLHLLKEGAYNDPSPVGFLDFQYPQSCRRNTHRVLQEAEGV
jgi:hypothetical protein